MRTVLVGVVAAIAVALVSPPPARTAPACAPPELGFGVGEGANHPTMPPTVGSLRVAMLFVDFSDAPADVPADALVDAYVPAVVGWYDDASYGRLRLVVDAVPQWLRMPRSLREYDDVRFVGAIEDVLAAADPRYDFEGVDALYLMTSQEAGTLASTIVDHVPRRVDGAEIRAWVWLAAGGSGAARPNVLIHETGHVLGLPDLYDVRRPGVGHHHWDIMAGSGGAGMLAWHRWKLGWLLANEVVCMPRRRLHVTSLTPLARPGGRKAVVLRARSSAVVVEVRARTGVDASLCKAGVLVYRVDFRRGAPEMLGRLGVPVEIGSARPGSSPRCGRDWRAVLGIGSGEVSRTTAFGVDVRVVAKLPGGAYRISVRAR